MSETSLRVGVVEAGMAELHQGANYFASACSLLERVSSGSQATVIVYGKLVSDEDCAQEACRFFVANAVDLVVVATTAFPNGNIAFPFARLDIPLALWSFPEPKTKGPLPTNSLCGMNMLSSTLTSFLRSSAIKWKWFFGAPGSPQLEKRLEATIAALAAIKSLRNSKIALIGGAANGFNDLLFDEGALFNRFRVRVVHGIEASEVIQLAGKMQPSEVAHAAATFTDSCGQINVDQDSLNRATRVYLALSNIASSTGCDALAVSCWPKFQTDFGIAVCAVLARLQDDGIVAACEGDVNGALSMLLLKALGRNTPTLLDLVAFDDNDDSIQVWHCGASPCVFSRDGTFSLNLHHHLTSGLEGDNARTVGVVRDMIFKESEVTFLQVNSTFERYFTFEGLVFEGKDSFNGSRGWIKELVTDGHRLSALDLMETIMTKGLQHHYVMAHGRASNVVREVASWLDLEPFEPAHYSDHRKQERK
jgi:L-fucose isomerase-like protein